MLLSSQEIKTKVMNISNFKIPVAHNSDSLTLKPGRLHIGPKYENEKQLSLRQKYDSQLRQEEKKQRQQKIIEQKISLLKTELLKESSS